MTEHSDRRVLDYATPEQKRSNRDLVLAAIICVLQAATQFLFVAGRASYDLFAFIQSDSVLFALPFAVAFVINLAILRRRGLLLALMISLSLGIAGYYLGMIPALNIYGG